VKTPRWTRSSRSLTRRAGYLAASLGAVALAIVVPTPAYAATSVTAANNGTTMTAANAGPSATYTQLGDITFNEGNSGEVSLGRFAVMVPTGFEFSTATTIAVDLSGSGSTRARVSASASCTSTSNTTINVTPTAGALTFYVCQRSTGSSDTTFTIQNPRVRPTASFPVAGGNMYLDNTAGAVTITGVTGGVGGTNLGTLTQLPGSATQLGVALPAGVTAGVAQTATVTARDTYGNTATGYRGAIRFTSTDPSATVPADYTFTAADNGVRAFTNGVTLRTAGARSVTATDKATASITGVASTTVTAAGASSMTLTGIANPTSAGASTSATVTVRDAFGNVATGYTGTVSFTSTDAAATLPAAYTFTGADAGTRTFTGLVLRTAGNQGVSVGDGTRSATQSPITVQPGVVHHLAVSPSSATITAGGSRSFTVQARDAADNNLGDVTSSTTFTISPNGTCVANSCSATVAGAHTVTATHSGATGTATLNVQPAAAVVSLTLSPSTIVADGAATSTATVHVADQYGNPRANDDVDIETDGDAEVSDVVNNGGGVYTATVTASTVAGPQTITATDGAQSASAVLTQQAGPASLVTLVLTPESIEADGVSTSHALITVADAFGNAREDDVVSLVTDGDVSISDITSLGFGAYIATVTASTTAGTETLTASSGAASTTAELAEQATLSVGGVSPSSRGQGANGGAWGQTITINGTGFTPGTQADFGPGVTVKFTTYVDANRLRAHIVVAPDAELGSRSVTAILGDGRSVVCEDCFTVTSGPGVTAVSPNEIGPGAQRTVVITGADFQSGVKVTVPGTGVAVTSVNLIDSGRISVGLSTAFAAAAGARDIVVTNPADGGSTVCSGCLMVTPGPVVTDVSPSVLGGGALTTVTVTGANFGDGARLSIAGTGVAVMSQSRVDENTLTATLSVAGAAAAGARVVSVVNSDGGRGSCATCFAVSAAPTVTGITPATLVRGATAQVTITGANFAEGAAVSLSTGVSVSDVTVVDAGTITATVSVSAGTGAGTRTVLVTNPDYGKGTCAGCFTVTR
jgi:hypothetical protein